MSALSQTLYESLFGNIDLGPTVGNTNLGYINIYMGQARPPPNGPYPSTPQMAHV